MLFYLCTIKKRQNEIWVCKWVYIWAIKTNMPNQTEIFVLSKTTNITFNDEPGKWCLSMNSSEITFQTILLSWKCYIYISNFGWKYLCLFFVLSTNEVKKTSHENLTYVLFFGNSTFKISNSSWWIFNTMHNYSKLKVIENKAKNKKKTVVGVRFYYLFFQRSVIDISWY